MKSLIILFIASALVNANITTKPSFQTGIKFDSIDKDRALKHYRKQYIKAKPQTITTLFGKKAGKAHTRPSDMLASVTFTKEDLRTRLNDYMPFFKGTLLDFKSILPKDPTSYDGFRIHVGIDTSSGKPKVACLVTFGKLVSSEKVKSKKDLFHNGYIQDNLNLGIYIIRGKELDFDKFPFILQLHTAIKTHRSCHPSCDGDMLL